jgi:DNA-binding response OmpR family regulator
MWNKGHILVVDDESAIRLFVSEELTQAGYRVSTAASGEEALALLKEEEPIDLVLLDLRMDDMEGLDVLAEIGQSPLSPVVIILTAYPSVDSVIDAMRLGGWDYLRKPCSTEDLLASVEKGMIHRRETVRQQAMLQLIERTAHRLQANSNSEETAESTGPARLGGRGLFLDPEQGSITKDGEVVPLTPTEFRLLLCLMERADNVVPFGTLMQELQGGRGSVVGANQALGTHVWRLRRKIGSAPDGTSYVVNVRGLGYKFVSGNRIGEE